MRPISIALTALLAVSCGQPQELTIEQTDATPVIAQMDIATPEVDFSDLDTLPGEHWRPRNFNFLAQCDRANVDERLPPAVWFDEYEDTKRKVFEEVDAILGTSQQPLLGEHVEFWQVWCPPTGWEEQHTILLVGLYLLEDTYYFVDRYMDTGNTAYLDRANFAFSESERYIFQGIRDAIPWYGDMPIYSEDSRVGTCLIDGLPDHWLVPLCDEYDGPVTDPNSNHYNPSHPTVADWPSD